MKLPSLAVLLAALSGNAIAAPSPDAAKLALRNYAEAAARAHTLAELKGHWSAKFSSENEALYAQQVAPLPPATRSLVEKRLLQAIATTVAAAQSSMVVTCTSQRCTARAKMPGDITQTYVLVEERGAMRIDSADTAAGPGT